MIDSLKSLLKFIRSRNILIDESIFRLHCLYTPMILFSFFLIITTNQIVGVPIDCDTNRDSVKSSVLNIFCLIHYTYTVENGFNKMLGSEVAAPGVQYGTRDQEIHHNYYQWIWFLFFVEAIFFYSPRWLWKQWENSLISHLVSDVNNFVSSRKNRTKKRIIVDFITRNRSYCSSYSRKYLLCLTLALTNVLIQMFLINYLFNGEFYTYGLRIFLFLSEDPNTRRDALIKIFPRVTKCRFNKFGSSGSIQELDALCVLPLNMYNEKIFVFLWFWFSILAILLYVSILIKLMLIAIPVFRYYYIKITFKINKKATDYELLECPKIDDGAKPAFGARNLTFGEIFVLLLIKQNTGHKFSGEVLKELIRSHRKKETDKKQLKQLMTNLNHKKSEQINVSQTIIDLSQTFNETDLKIL